MTHLIYEMSVPVFDRMLGNLDGLLAKAAASIEARKLDPVSILGARLYPDMFPFTRQVQLASDFAKGATARLSGVELPRYDDTETSIADLSARIARTRSFINGVDRSLFEGSAERIVAIPMRDRTVSLPGLDYLRFMAMPNFYFHVTTAYDILRHNGVEVGKRDFTGAL